MLALWSNPNAPALRSNPNAGSPGQIPTPALRSNPNAGSPVKSQHQLFSQNVALII